jgi:hypothetical protein
MARIVNGTILLISRFPSFQNLSDIASMKSHLPTMTQNLLILGLIQINETQLSVI